MPRGTNAEAKERHISTHLKECHVHCGTPQQQTSKALAIQVMKRNHWGCDQCLDAFCHKYKMRAFYRFEEQPGEYNWTVLQAENSNLNLQIYMHISQNHWCPLLPKPGADIEWLTEAVQQLVCNPPKKWPEGDTTEVTMPEVTTSPPPRVTPLPKATLTTMIAPKVRVEKAATDGDTLGSTLSQHERTTLLASLNTVRAGIHHYLTKGLQMEPDSYRVKYGMNTTIVGGTPTHRKLAQRTVYLRVPLIPTPKEAPLNMTELIKYLGKKHASAPYNTHVG